MKDTRPRARHQRRPTIRASAPASPTDPPIVGQALLVKHIRAQVEAAHLDDTVRDNTAAFRSPCVFKIESDTSRVVELRLNLPDSFKTHRLFRRQFLFTSQRHSNTQTDPSFSVTPLVSWPCTDLDEET